MSPARLLCVLPVLLFALLSSLQDAAAQPSGGDPDAGRLLYERGIGADGTPVLALTRNDLEIDGSQLTCMSCHRPSGMGKSEGDTYVPPITARHLFAPRQADADIRAERFKEYYKDVQSEEFYQDLRKGRLRPAYDPASLVRAITEGVDPAGRALNSVMPRYALSERDAADLVAYLETLSASDDPGVEPDRVHLATIVAGEIDEAREEAFVATVGVFVDWFNRDIADDLARPGFSPYYRSDFTASYRQWEWHLWRLEGDPATWREQLETLYAGQPVFAVLSGLVAGDFAPVADFCDDKRLPCLFPITDLPRTKDAEGRYTLYFSRGLELEAQALARHLAGNTPPSSRLLQIHMDDAYGRAAAAAFTAALSRSLPEAALETRAAADMTEFAAGTREAGKADTLVLWPGMAAGAAIEAIADLKPSAARITLPSHALAPAQERLGEAMRSRVLFTYPYNRPGKVQPDSFRTRAWLRSRRLPIVDWDMQRKAYYAGKMAQWAMSHLLTDYHRDYLIEIIEHQVENAFTPGPYPKLALGPGQRFASKGAFILRLDSQAPKGLAAVSDWIVP